MSAVIEGVEVAEGGAAADKHWERMSVSKTVDQGSRQRLCRDSSGM